ncbi:MAG: SDR family oxidoreductase [Alphaproteobacteria bacterium]|nr:SDR family oxidoreductase [Alphaproteobacteria bacterium]
MLRIFGGLLFVILAAIGAFILSMRAQIPDDRFDLQPVFSESVVTEQGRVIVFGATRNTGLEVVKILRARGEPVTALVRPTSDRSELEALGVDLVEGDAMDPASLAEAFEGQKIRAVVTTIGCLNCEPPPDYEGNRNIAEAAKAAGVKRMLLVTTIGAGDSADTPPFVSRAVLQKILPMKTKAEEHLKGSGLDYTIVRPGGLMSKPPTGNGFLSEDVKTFGFIFRADLAQLIVACLDDPNTIGKTFAAADLNRSLPWSE